MNNLNKIKNYKKSSKKYLYLLLVFILLIIVYTLFSKPKEVTSLYTYITQKPKKDDLTMLVSATGYLTPTNTINLGSEVSGTIKSLYVDYNEQVKKGQVLAKLDQTKYMSALLRSRASLASAKANLAVMQAHLYSAQTTMKRDKDIRKSTKGSLPSATQWDRDWAALLEAKAQIDNAKAQVEQAKQALISAQYDLDKTTVYAPINGVVLERNIEIGQTVAASFQTPILFKISDDLRKMELQVSIDEADIGKIKEGQKAYFSVDAYMDKKFEATIKSIRLNSQTVNGVVTYKTILSVDNSDLLIKPGMSADASIITKTFKNVLIIPRSALLYVPIKDKKSKMFDFHNKPEKIVENTPHVWVLVNGKPKKVTVKVLGNNGIQTAIESKELNTSAEVILMQEKRK